LKERKIQPQNSAHLADIIPAGNCRNVGLIGKTGTKKYDMNPQDGYIQYIVNPKSGASSNKQLVCGFRDYLQDHGFDVRLVFTESLAHACELRKFKGSDTILFGTEFALC